MKKFLFKLVLSIAISLLLLYYVLQCFDVNKTLIFIQNAKLSYLCFSFLLIVIAYIVRGYRWMIWEQELTYWDSFKLILIGFMGNNLLPARFGEILRAHCTAQKTGESYGGTSALASIAIERVLDGLILSFIGILGLFFVSVSRGLFYSLLFVSLLFGFLTVGLVVGIHIHEEIRHAFDRIHRIFPGHLTRFGEEKVNYFLDGLLLIKNIGRFFNAIFATVLIWAIEIVAYYLIANAVSLGVPLKMCFIFLAVVNFASLFPFTVGGIGAIEGAATVFLISAGISENQALAMVAIQHILQLSFTTITGSIFYFTDGYYNISFQRKRRAQNDQLSKTPFSMDIVDDTNRQIEKLSSNLNIQKSVRETPGLSIVIPAYNEQHRLPKTVLETIAWCTENTIKYELILVDDGSKDDTLSLAKLFTTQVKDIRYIACPHLGKGAAVKMGMLNAIGNYVLFMDADGATPLDEIPKLMMTLEAGADIAIGSRVSQYPNEAEVITSSHRKIIGRTFAALVNIFAIPGFGDTQCGFKIFRHAVIQDVFSRQRVNGFAFDVEILYIAKKLGFSIVEIPVNWVSQEGSKVSLVTDSTKMLIDILRIYWLHKDEKWRKM